MLCFGISFASQFLLGFYQCFAFAFSSHKVSIETYHQFGCRVVVHILKTHQQGVYTGILEATLQTYNAVCAHLSESGLTRRKSNKVAFS